MNDMSDLIPRKSVEYICRKEVVNTNPDDFVANEKFIRFMDDPEIASFGRWERANGFNTGLIAVQCGIKKVPSVQNVTDTNVGNKSDLVDRQAAIETVRHAWAKGLEPTQFLEELPSAQSEPCEYYALCRHGRDENELRARLGFCKYCMEDADGFVTPMEKNGHAFVRFGMNGWELSLKANGWHGSAKIRYCPMCGRDLLVK